MVHQRLKQQAAFAIVATLVWSGSARVAAEQSSGQAELTLSPVANGDCSLTVSVRTAAASSAFEVQIGKNPLTTRTLEAPAQDLVILLRAPLREGDEVRARIAAHDWVSAIAAPSTKSVTECGLEPASRKVMFKPRASDGREPFEASMYTGWAVDNFAPNSIANYPSGSTVTNKTQWVGGIDFDFRLDRGDRDFQVWLAGETLHGVRTADVDCGNPDNKTLCTGLGALDPKNAGSNFNFIVKHASSLEAYVSPRVELYTLHRGSASAAKVYAGARFGVLGLAEGLKLFNAHHVGGGLLMVGGPFEGSSIEVGIGRSELFAAPDRGRRWNRLKIDSLLSWDLVPGWRDKVNPFMKAAGSTGMFIELYVDDNPGGHDAKSIQTFFGINVDVRNMFGK